MRMKHSLLNMLVTTIPNLILPVMGIIKFSLFSSIYGGSINGLYYNDSTNGGFKSS